jgi:hypothetical protein
MSERFENDGIVIGFVIGNALSSINYVNWIERTVPHQCTLLALFLAYSMSKLGPILGALSKHFEFFFISISFEGVWQVFSNSD